MNADQIAAVALLVCSVMSFLCLACYCAGTAAALEHDTASAYDLGVQQGRVQALDELERQTRTAKPSVVVHIEGELSEKAARDIRSGWGR